LNSISENQNVSVYICKTLKTDGSFWIIKADELCDYKLLQENLKRRNALM